eukprot:365296-Chlamydomonas_euryale.AAC.32
MCSRLWDTLDLTVHLGTYPTREERDKHEEDCCSCISGWQKGAYSDAGGLGCCVSKSPPPPTHNSITGLTSNDSAQ